ncbi:hypothetical protein KR038_004176, partial [Drosophila bunnanda]
QCSSRDATIGLMEHNRLRELHGVPPLTLRDDLSSQAAAHARVRSKIVTIIFRNPSDTQLLADKQALEHSKSDGMYGENLCYRSLEPEKCVQNWYDEIVYYDYSKPRFSFQTGHFTQVVWADSTEMGWGQAKDVNGVYYVVAVYTPAGNIQGEFEKNVLRPLS